MDTKLDYGVTSEIIGLSPSLGVAPSNGRAQPGSIGVPVSDSVIGSMPIVLFLCAGNSCRSQMAEAFLRELAGDRFVAYSAGTKPAEAINPLAVEVMSEVGIDIRSQNPKSVAPLLGRLAVRHLIIVCDQAEQDCPRVFPGALTRTFAPFADPATVLGTREHRLDEFRRVRDQIEQRVRLWTQEFG